MKFLILLAIMVFFVYGENDTGTICIDSIPESLKYLPLWDYDTMVYQKNDYARFTSNNEIIYYSKTGDTVFHYDMKKEIWIKRRVSKTTAIFMLFKLAYGN